MIIEFKSRHQEAEELNIFLSDDRLRQLSGIDDEDASISVLEEEALQLARNFKVYHLIMNLTNLL